MNQKNGEENRVKSGNVYNCIIIGAGKQGALSDAPGSGNEHKIISFAHALKEYPNGGWFNSVYRQDPLFKIGGIIDISDYAGLKAGDLWGVPYYQTKNIKHLCQGHIDVAIVTTPDDNHYEILKELANYKLKLVICEKPIATDLQQAREIVELYKAKNIPLMVNYTRRFLPEYDKLKQYGNPIDGFCTFNRGWIHSATHGIDFFEMLGLKNYKISQIDTEDFRVWDLTVYFDTGQYWNERRIGDMPVWSYYDKSHLHIIENAYNFLEGRESLKCTGENGLRALEICFKLMEGRNG